MHENAEELVDHFLIHFGKVVALPVLFLWYVMGSPLFSERLVNLLEWEFYGREEKRKKAWRTTLLCAGSSLGRSLMEIVCYCSS